MPSKRKLAAAAKQRRQKKKIILFLVEGPSEINALETALAQTCECFDEDIEVLIRTLREENMRTHLEDKGGDITSKYGINSDNVEKMINKLFFKPFLQETRIYPKDISRVVQIVDTDGTFIPNSNIVPSTESIESVQYLSDRIVCPNVTNIIERNARKSSNLRHLMSINEIAVEGKKRPYSVYFFSTNLDHYLHGDANLARSKKVALANDFSRQCDMKPSLFYELIQADSDYCDCSYKESWERIQVGCHSLERHTNLGLLLAELKEGYWD